MQGTPPSSPSEGSEARILRGNAARDGEPFRGWFIGGFVPPQLGLRATDALEVKWGTHASGEARAGWAASDAAMSLSVLVRGCIRLFFSGDQQALLDQPGDYVVWAPGVSHRWEIEQDDTVVLTVRWPSREPSPAQPHPVGARGLTRDPDAK